MAQGGSDPEPDYRFSLANERTFLAWNRTALALVAGGAGVAELLPGVGSQWMRTAIGVWLVTVGIVVTLLAPRRLRAVQDAMRRGGPLPTTRLVDVIAIGSGAAAVALLAILLLD